MPARVSALPLYSGEVTDEQLLILNANFDIIRISAQRFRGAGFFTGTGVGTPSSTFPVAGGAFKDGDMFRQTSGATTTLWFWDETLDPDGWLQFESLTQPFFHSAVTMGNTTMEVATGTSVTDATVGEGDFYRNLTDQRLYGPYHVVNGFDFSVENRAGFVWERGPQQYVHPAGSTGRDVATWGPGQIVSAAEVAYGPQRGDTYQQDLADPEHGGFLWTWDEDAYQIASGNYSVRITAGWGLKRFTRSPRIFVGIIPPVANHTKYITGDEYRDTASNLLYGPYDGSGYTAVDEATDRDTTWGDTPTTPFQNANNITSQDTYDLPYGIAVDNTAYIDGDYRFCEDNRETPALFGPYTTASGGTWPRLHFLRMNTEHTVTQGADGTWQAFTSSTGGIYGVAPISDDTVRYIHTFPTGHASQGQANGKERVSTITVTYATSTVAPGTTSNPNARQTHLNTSPGRLAFDDNIYSTGDLLQDSDKAIYGPYVEGQGTDTDAWPVLTPGLSTAGLRVTKDGTSDVYELHIDANDNIYFVGI